MRAESKLFSYLSEIQNFKIPFFLRAYVWKNDDWKNFFVAMFGVLFNVSSREI